MTLSDHSKAIQADAAALGIRLHGDAAGNPDSKDWAMFSPVGNAAVGVLVALVRVKISDGDGPKVIARMLKEGMKDIAEMGHTEVHDTMVRETIYAALEVEVTKAFGSDEALQIGLS